MVRKRVLMVISNFYPVIGGAERQLLKLGSALTKCGWKVRVLTRRTERHLKRRESIKGIEVIRFSSFRMPARRGLGPINKMLDALQTSRLVKEHAADADVVHGHIASPLILHAARGAHSVGRFMICKIASGGPFMDLKVEESRGRLGRLVVQGLVREVDGWIAVSEEIARQLEGDYGIPHSKIFRIGNGVEIPTYSKRTERPVTARRFLYLGRLTSGKYRDFTWLLRAFSKAWERCPDCQLAIVGSGNGELEVKRSLEELGGARRSVLMPGFSDPEPWLEWADVLVQPSLVEGMSNSILEGMAHGLACIATDIPPNRELLDNGRAGILVPCSDVDAMAEAMLEVAFLPDRAANLGSTAKDRAAKCFSIDVIAGKYAELYERLACGKS
ncbi:MAG: glycosyltransferase family 4 protein [Thermodesulfobacteriota bacterium]